MTDNEITIKIDDLEIKTIKDRTILETALNNGIYIPHLCYNPELKPFGACRLCMIQDVEGRLFTACEAKAVDGMSVLTDSPQINSIRKMVAQLLIANHEWECLTCARDNNCKLQEVAAYMGITDEDQGGLRKNIKEITPDNSNPFFIRDLKKCIICGICVRVCNEIMGVRALDFGFRGYGTKIIASLDKSIKESDCISCGECVVACPVGALVPKVSYKPSREVETICPYCGVGCGIFLGIRGNQVINVRGNPDNPVNKGKLCVKGRYGLGFVNNPQRLTSPLIKRNGRFEEVEWNEALDLVALNFSKYINSYKKYESNYSNNKIEDKRNGDNAFAVIASAKCTNEENYLIQKFTRAVLGTNNIDHCARLCHAATVSGLSLTLGGSAMTNSIDEISDSNCILAIGTNTTSTHPIIGIEIIKASKSGSKLIVVNPQEIDLCKHADLFLQTKPGSDVALIMGMIRVILDEGLYDEEYINHRCQGFSEFKESIKEFDMNSAVKITGIKEEKIREAARLYASDNPSSIFYAMGITQHCHGTDNVMAISNLALLAGNIGKYSAGINPLRGQNNVQGACDMGVLPDVYPGYQRINEHNNLIKFQDAWDCKLNSEPGLTLPEIIDSSLTGKLKSLYIVGENPVLSEPDSSRVIKSLENLDFLVVQDIFLTETAELADVVLPASSFAEKDGTFTNTERKVQRIRKAIKSYGNSKADWQIICELAKKMGSHGFDFNHPEEILQEINSLTPIYGGINFKRLDEDGLQWPCKDVEDPGTKFLYQDKFSTDNGKARFMPMNYQSSAEIPDKDYPFILTTGRNLYQYHTGTMSRRVYGLNNLYGQEQIEINPNDALELEVEEGDLVYVVSHRGRVKAKVKLTSNILQGLVSMTFHFSETPTNLLTNSVLDPVSFTPELKVCAVRVEKI